MTETIYIPLEDEGISVNRPVRAYALPDGRFIVLRPSDYDPALESWTFPPGSVVECEARQTAEGTKAIAVRRVMESESTPGKQSV